ncbi:MAG TPA: ABC transporter ATP-binding protein [Anaerolineaceae bacterium]|nr:ABC transporter ATP-binding protein [Anaerolineaceae bacterium]
MVYSKFGNHTMPLLTVHNLSKSFGAFDLFSDLTFSIPHRARLGLVGPNGIGKTTLLKIILGEEEASSGKISKARGIQIGYLPQEAVLVSDRTLWTECMTVFAPLIDKQHELTRLEGLMAHDPANIELIETYGHLQAEFDALGGYTYELQTRMTLTGLGFTREDESRPLSQLSGGQRTRALLAKLLLSNPDLLLLDEPTNHLDIEAVEWLESYLKDWHGAVLIVSHDRYFLDQVTTSILEMNPTLEEYRGNYSAYLMQREERYQRRLIEYQDQQEFIEKEEDYIRRNIAGQNTRQAQGRRTRLERMLAEARLTPPMQRRNLHLNLGNAARSGDLVLRTYGLQVGYADEGRPLFSVPDLTLVRSECAAIIGPNGAGKTTFLRTILEQIDPYAGETRLGSSLQIGYFAQAHEGLHSDWTLMQEIQAQSPKMLPGEIRDYLAKFLFTGEDVFKEVNLLSGGERGRLALALLALKGANLLLLDEPTNHLDLPSQEILQSVLAEFKGTILLVSHDRFLIDALATQVWEVLPTRRELVVFKGTYSEYKASKIQPAPVVVPAKKPEVVSSKPRMGLSKGEQAKIQKRIELVEEKISQIETRLKVIEVQLENPPTDAARVHKLGNEYTSLHQELEAHLEDWSKLVDELNSNAHFSQFG